MSQYVIARRYAKALANLAEQNNALESAGRQLADLAGLIGGSEELRDSLRETRISSDEKRQVIQALLDRLGSSSLISTFSCYLLSKRRILLLPDISRAFAQILQERLGRMEAQVTATRELDDSVIQSLEQQLSEYTGKKVNVQVQIDPSIIGGIVTRVGSVVIDGSIRNQLYQVHQSIIRG